MTRNLNEIFRGGYCTRWHANPDMAHIRETLAEHHARVAQIILALHPAPTLALVDAALHHDAGEPEVGDVRWPAKRANPVLATLLDAAEDKAREDLGLTFDLFPDDVNWLKLADRLAAYMHAAHTAPRVLDTPDWINDGIWILDTAARLGVVDAVVAACPLIAHLVGRAAA